MIRLQMLEIGRKKAAAVVGRGKPPRLREGRPGLPSLRGWVATPSRGDKVAPAGAAVILPGVRKTLGGIAPHP